MLIVRWTRRLLVWLRSHRITPEENGKAVDKASFW